MPLVFCALTRSLKIFPLLLVYQLGVLLYGLLTGRSPYRVPPGDALALHRAILEEEPVRPSVAVRSSPGGRPGGRRDDDPPPDADDGATARAGARGTSPDRLGRRLAGDLDTILLMALRKDPGRRYASVAQLAGDLDRRFRKYSRRIFEKYDMDQVGFWIPLENPEHQLIYILSYEDCADRDPAWDGFLNDPEWLRIKLPTSDSFLGTRNLLNDLRLHTVCESAKCPNHWECWSKGTARRRRKCSAATGCCSCSV